MSAARRVLATVLAALALLAPVTARAHGRSTSYSRWTIRDDGAAVVFRVRRGELVAAGLSGDPRALARYVPPRLRLLAGGTPCTAGPVHARDAGGDWLELAWSVACPEGGRRALESRLLQETAAAHLHFVRIVEADGRSSERVLQAGDGAVVLPGVADTGADESLRAAFVRFVRLGVEHIATGWDHLAFVLALLLLATSIGEVVSLATGFTIAHSLTLALAVTGVARPAPQAVEALIGFSIALVAAENGWLLAGEPRVVPVAVTGGLLALAAGAVAGAVRVDALVLVGLACFSLCHFALLARVPRPARLRVAVAFAFGLIHGFGFAGVLAEMALPPGRLVVALAGFNVGVELGQLAAIALAWPLLALAVRLRLGRVVAEVGSAALCGTGVFWLLVRAFGR